MAELDPRWLQFPASFLLELGIDLAPYVGRSLPGGCHLCAAETVLMAPAVGRERWSRTVSHQMGCPMPRWRGRRFDAIQN